MWGWNDKESLCSKIDPLFAKSTRQLKGRARKLHDAIARLGRKGVLSESEALSLRARVYDFEMERGIAASGFGIRTLRNLGAAASFRRSMYHQLRRESLRPSLARMLVQDKVSARHLMALMGASLPRATGVMPLGEALGRCRDDPPFEHMVLKPTLCGGGNGVFMVDRGGIYRVKTKEHLAGFEEMERSARETIARKRIPESHWIIEERVQSAAGHGTPPKEYKFLCFYGRGGLANEIAWTDRRRFCYWSPEGKRVPVVRGYRTHEGEEPRLADLECVAALSGRLPFPYVRFDFYDGRDGLVFGEMSVGLGGFDRMERGLDRALGELYLDAESRLHADLLKGKQFPEFMDTLKAFPVFAGFVGAAVPAGSASVAVLPA